MFANINFNKAVLQVKNVHFVFVLYIRNMSQFL